MTTILEIDLGPLLPAFPEFVAGIVLFLIIWYAMAKKVVPMFEKTYTERAAAIQGGIEKAEQAQAEAAAALQQYREQLAGARAEASSIREEAKAQGAEADTIAKIGFLTDGKWFFDNDGDDYEGLTESFADKCP